MHTFDVEVKVIDKKVDGAFKIIIFVIPAYSEEEAIEKSKKYGEPIRIIPNSKTKLSKDWR